MKFEQGMLGRGLDTRVSGSSFLLLDTSFACVFCCSVCIRMVGP